MASQIDPNAKQIAAAATRGRTLAIGFGITVAMWAVAYVAMMKPGFVIGEALFVTTLGCLFIGGLVAGRTLHKDESPAMVGARIGALSATLNLLLIGSLIGGKSSREMLTGALMWGAGTYIASIALCTIGSIAGARTQSLARRHLSILSRNWHFTFMIVAGATVFLLLITGGLVTGLEAGLAVPDWPNSFGHNMLLYPVSEMVGGVFYEHAHRLYGMLVGVTAIAVVVSMVVFDRRGWLRVLGVAYLLAVCVQGFMGGMRVTEISTTLAIIHGVFAQIVFASIVCIATFTSTAWRSAAVKTRPSRAERNWVIALTILFVMQIALGALYRHLQRDMKDPPNPLHPLFTHMGLALIITVLAVFIGGRAWGIHRDKPALPAIGGTLLILIGVQLMLGTGATIVVWMSQPDQPPPRVELLITTAHQVTGALLLATSALLTVWYWRLSAPRGNGVADEGGR